MPRNAAKGIGLQEKVIRFYQKSLDDAQAAQEFFQPGQLPGILRANPYFLLNQALLPESPSVLALVMR